MSSARSVQAISARPAERHGRNRQTQIDIRGDIFQPQSICSCRFPRRKRRLQQHERNIGESFRRTGAVNPWTSANQVLRVGDVATVVDGNEPRTMNASVNGINGVFLSVQKTSSSSEVTGVRQRESQRCPGSKHNFPTSTSAS